MKQLLKEQLKTGNNVTGQNFTFARPLLDYVNQTSATIKLKMHI